jgi:hypothetical protein
MQSPWGLLLVFVKYSCVPPFRLPTSEIPILLTLFPVQATPITVFEKDSTIATTDPIIALTIIAVSNQVPCYYVLSYSMPEYIHYGIYLNTDLLRA